MRIKALITGVEHIMNKPDSEKKFNFYKLNFIDTENPSGTPQACSLPREGEELNRLLPILEKMKLTTQNLVVFQNGTYANFGSIA